jgi:hypothetical protein
MDEELMRDIHKELLQEIRERESDIWKFWTIFISAFGGWTAAAWKYFDNSGKCNDSSEYLLIFLVVSAFALILLSWGLCLVLYYGYHYRMFQKVLYDIEKEQGLIKGKIIPYKWNPCRCKPGKFLFSASPELQSELDEGKTDKLREEFKENKKIKGVKELQNPKVIVKECCSWKIKDDKQVYIIKDKFNIYTEKKLDLPEIYKVHCYAFISAIILIVIASILLCVLRNIAHWYYIALAFLLPIAAIISIFIHYRKKMNKFCSEEDQICKK